MGDVLGVAAGFAIVLAPAEARAAFAGTQFEDAVRADATHDQYGTGPIGPFGTAAAEVSEVAGLPVRFLLTTGWLVGVVDQHAGAAIGVEGRVELVAQKATDVFLRVGFAADVGQGRVNPEQVGLVFLNQGDNAVLEKIVAREGVLPADDDVGESLAGFRFAEAQAEPDAITHLGQVAVVVLGLDEQGLKRAGRLDAEGVAAQRPEQHELHGERTLADAGRADQQQAATATKIAVAEQFVRVGFGRADQLT